MSEMTVRRDIELLAEQGLLEKVHGGATAVASKITAVEPPFQSKSLREQLAKDAIAARAALEITPGSSIALMGGSTVFAVAKLAVTIPGLTIVTNSLPVSDLFSREGQLNQTVVLTGGLRTPTDSFVGEITVQAFSCLNLDLLFMGTHGMDVSGGYSSPNLLEAETNRAVNLLNSYQGLFISSLNGGLSGRSLSLDFVAVTKPVADPAFCAAARSGATMTLRPLGLDLSTVKGGGKLK